MDESDATVTSDDPDDETGETLGSEEADDRTDAPVGGTSGAADGTSGAVDGDGTGREPAEAVTGRAGDESAEAGGPDGGTPAGAEPVAAKDTEEMIMEATFRALSKRGYNELRLRDIGAEMEMTRQVIHYHFDGKYDLLASFLEHVIEQYEGSVQVDQDADPRTELDARIDQCLFGPGFEDFGHWDRMKVYHELFAHARNDERHRNIFDEHYDRIRGGVVEVVEDGIDQGVFRDVDAHRMGQLITDVIHVARARRISLGHEDAPEEARKAIDEFVLDSLYADG